MVYKYSYNDWLNGTIIWNDIISHEIDGCYISDKCREKIIKRQKTIFNKLTKAHLHSLINGLKLETKSSVRDEEIIDSHLKTIDNLFSGLIDGFENTEVILYTKADPDSYSDILLKKQIPPLMVTTFDKGDIERIRESKQKYFMNNGVWNYSVIETQEMHNLVKYADYQAEVWASAYYEFRTMLLDNKGNFKNTASFGLNKDNLRALRNKLTDNNFIVKTNSELFLRIFSGTFLYDEEKITWNSSISCLNYFISELEYFGMHTPKGFGKWDCIGNSFRSSNIDIAIKPEALRKVKKSEITFNDKEKIDNIISFLKRLSRQ